MGTSTEQLRGRRQRPWHGLQLTPGGVLTTLVTFGGANGGRPEGGLVQVTNGDFYGSNQIARTYGAGTVFSLSVGLGAFVETQPHFGAPGAAITILGTGLTGATSVSFNWTPGAFYVATYIRTTVPAGADNGCTLFSGVPCAAVKPEIYPLRPGPAHRRDPSR